MSNKYSEIFTAGCSFFERAYDHDLENSRNNKYDGKVDSPDFWYQHSFPKLLSDKLNLPFTNVAKPGHSNSFIIRSAYDFITNRNNDSHAVMVLGLTSLSRKELQAPKDNKYHPVTPTDHHVNHPNYLKYFSQYIEPEKFSHLIDNNYKYLFNTELALNELIQQLNMLEAYARVNRIKLIVFFSFFKSHNLHLSDKIFDPKNAFDYFNFGFGDQRVLAWTDFIDLYAPNHKGGHPFIYDNNVLANYLASYINNGKVERLVVNPKYYTAGLDLKFI